MKPHPALALSIPCIRGSTHKRGHRLVRAGCRQRKPRKTWAKPKHFEFIINKMIYMIVLYNDKTNRAANKKSSKETEDTEEIAPYIQDPLCALCG